ncbi:ATP-binding cassette domain-containing protein [Lysinibacillus sp. NPDC093712]|uniref:ATP-binding cassette domain-containing protein n=1 Tax=Lysinibacillus sp. NPDC093712 TaxID=3390579 RepID=UPI003D01EBB4
MGYELKNVTVEYDNQTALKNISCSISDGKWIAIIGKTGAGKSTFVQLFKGLVDFKGEYRLHNNLITLSGKGQKKDLQEIGYVFQYPEHQFFETTVYKELAFGLKQIGQSEKEIRASISEILPKVGLDETILTLAPFQLSGGQKRRVAIASIILMQPKLLILDEPTAGLDPISKSTLLDFLKEWQLETNHTVLFVTHQMQDVAEYANEVIVLHEGEIQAHLNTNQLFLQQAHIVTRAGLAMPEQLQLLKVVEQLLGEKIAVANCKEQTIFNAVKPYLQFRGKLDA